MKKKPFKKFSGASYRSVVFRVYRDEKNDKILGIPPLFNVEVQFTDLDLERLKACPDVTFKYELKSPL